MTQHPEQQPEPQPAASSARPGALADTPSTPFETRNPDAFAWLTSNTATDAKPE
ncbi:hypothetical protein [Silvimonas iriomotensis]|uniref:Uncharacterized protein n=1 Tax=Silvimonas iriomotensis TaxID=449662 RepID=A0ABQ2PD69_9NEIS|nr:hypothetical protein [Silvimonas iriomotensis]GGP23100.1 hypothetical protein GCM10010970_31000 [Silvimonas iriomotensis]